MGQIIDGKYWAKEIKKDIAEKVKVLSEKGKTPKLTVILVGDNSASKVYVGGKEKDCIECGFDSEIIRMPEETTQDELLEKIVNCNNDDNVDGLIVQLPLPAHIDTQVIMQTISPKKDVDGFTPINMGKLVQGDDCFLPCTPAGCMYLIKTTGIDITGKNAVVVGRSNIVGKPMALLLTAENATVTLCHSKTKNLKEICANADILVAAIGKAKFITADMVKEGAVVIDVGMNRDENGKLCGDVDFENAKEKAGFITPVPGGVGLMTRAYLMNNTLKAIEK